VEYASLKLTHQTAVALSATGFCARGLGAFVGARWVRGRAARTVPHIVDTVLLASALALAWALRLNPVSTPWLAAKIVGLLLYIALGMLALRPGRPLAVRIAAWVAALVTLVWIVSVALTKNPLGWLLPLVNTL
jgi:uncharacterized membrane protein SirB2